MRRFLHLAILTACCVAPTIGTAAAQGRDVPLSSVARTAHLSYSWLAGARAVQLSGPGIVLVLRPGDNLYEVNDRVEISDVPPRAVNDDMYVSQTLATHIAALARYARDRVASLNSARANGLVRAAETAQPHGAISMNVEQLKGAEAVLITGEAPPSAPVLITLLGLISSDVPNVVIGRHDLQAGSDGRFQAIVPIGPDYVRGSYVRVLATSSPGVSSASAQILIAPANAGLSVPFEQMPGGIW